MSSSHAQSVVRSSCGNVAVECSHPRSATVNCETFLKSLATSLAKGGSELRCADHPRDCVSKCYRVTWRDEERTPSTLRDLTHRWDIGADDRKTHRHGLDHRSRETFAQGRE